MAEPIDNLFVVTGGPGSGKSTLIAALAAQGFATMPEAGRTVIRAQMAEGGSALPWADRAAFAEAMLRRDMQSYREAQGHGAPVFFDRGVPDVVGYLRLSGLAVPAHMEKAATDLRYNARVFIAPPWREIFHQDAERKQDFAEAVRTCDAMTAVYRDLGYDLIVLPCAPVEDRVRFVRDMVATARA